MRVFLTQPWLHFVVIGLLLYAAQQWLQPVPPTIIAPPSEEKIAELRGQWLRATGRPPSELQVQRLVENEIDQEILFQEALTRNWHITDPVVRQRLIRDMRFLDPDSRDSDEQLVKNALAMELHENDLVVRRRLVQRMEMLAFAPLQGAEPELAVLEEMYQQNSSQLLHPAQVQFQHSFISRDKFSDPKERALEMLALVAGDQSPERGKSLSSPFLHGLAFGRLNAKQIGRYFGVEFADKLVELAAETASTTGWQGPLRSSYGEHLLWVESYRPPTAKNFAEVKKQLLGEWRRQQEQERLALMLAELREHYIVRPVDGGLSAEVVNAR